MTILVVDDNEANRYQLQVLLGAHGYEVVSAVEGVEALAKARQQPPDLIISDILMPVMDGFALCRQWQNDKRLRLIPFIFYTATYTDMPDQEFALSLGAFRFLIKPEEPEVILRVISEALQQALQPPAALTPRPVATPMPDDVDYLKQYSGALVRKLEAKMQQLAQTNRELEKTLAEREQAQAALQAGQNLLTQVEKIASIGGWTMNLVTRKATWTQGTYDIGEIAPDQPIPGPDEHVNYYLPEYRPMVAEAMRAFIENDKPLDFEAQLRTAKGNIKWCRAMGRSVRKGGKAVEVYGVFQDVTEHKQARAKIENQLEELKRWQDVMLGREDRVQELKREVNALCRRLSEPVRYPSQNGNPSGSAT